LSFQTLSESSKTVPWMVVADRLRMVALGA